MSAEAFLQLHRDLVREGPGESADIEWLGEQIDLPDRALIADLGCGPGADIADLLALAPESNLVAIDHQPHFLEQACVWQGDARVDIRLGDMGEPGGRFDLLWCAGALYFLGIQAGLQGWRSSPTTGGVIAFSEPCFWKNPPSDAVARIWSGYPDMRGEAGIGELVSAAGYETIATRRLADSAWGNYYLPILERMSALQAGASNDLRQVMAEQAAEIAAWDEYGDEFGYLLSVVRPV